jgi:hypothetical protein
MNGEKEPGATVLLAISQEFGKSVDWLLTGKEHAEQRKRVAKDSAKILSFRGWSNPTYNV